MGGPWEKYKQVQAGDAPAGPWTKYQASADDSDGPGVLDHAKAAIQGMGQFVTGGYIPELTAAAGSLIPNPTAGLDAKLKAQGFDIQQPANTFDSRRDASRAMQAKMSADDPISYYGGGALGAVASAPIYGAALSGLGIAKTVAPVAADAGLMAKAGNLGARMFQAGKEGAALGFASNPNTKPGESGFNLGGRLVNGAVSGALSSTVPAAADIIKGGANVAGGAAKWGGTKLLSSFGGVKPDVIKEYAQFSDRINAAPTVESLKQVSDEFVGKLSADVDAKKLSLEQAQDAFKGFESDLKDTYRTAGYDARDALSSAQQSLKDAHNERIQNLSQDVYDTIKQLKGDLSKGSSESFDILDKSGASVPVAPIKKQITTLINGLKIAGKSAVGDDATSAVNQLQTLRETLDNFPKNLPATEAKKMLQQLQRSTDYSRGAGTFSDAANKAFQDVNSTLNTALKSRVPEYAEKMQQVASHADLLNRVQDFGDRQTAAGLLARINSPNQLERRAALQELGKKYGSDFVAAAQPENLPQQGLLNRAQSQVDALRPDRVSEKIEGSLAASRQKSALDAAKSSFEQAEQKLSPFKSLAPNSAGQTQAQQKLMALAKGNNIELEGMFNELGKLTDTDFARAMKDRHILAAFEKGATNGSRNTLMGSIVGFAFGGLAGGTVGATAGRAVDQWGPAITKKILDGAIQVSKSPSLATISSLEIPEPVKRNMVIGLENYLAKERPVAGPRMVADGGDDSDASRGVASPQPKGEDLWTKRGADKLGLSPERANRLSQSKEMKRLLIEASDLAPDSKAMQRIKEQIQKAQGSK